MELNTGVNKSNSLKLSGFSGLLSQDSNKSAKGNNTLNTNMASVVKPDAFVKSLLDKGSTTKINQTAATTRKVGVKNIGGNLKYSGNAPMIIKMPTLSNKDGEYTKKIKKVVGGEAPDIKSFKNMSKVKMLKLKRKQKTNNREHVDYKKIKEDLKPIRSTITEKAGLSHRMETTPNVSENKLMSGLADNKFAQMFLGSSRPNPVQMKRVQTNNVVPGYSTQGFGKISTQGTPQMDKNPMMDGVNEKLRRLNSML